MMAVSIGIVLALSLWSAFDVAMGTIPPIFDNFCEVPSECQQLVQITFPCGFSTCVHYVLIYTSCTKHEPCARSYLSPWSKCTASCKPGGTRTRTFTCTTGSGLSCTQTQTEKCNEKTPCKVDVDGNWGQWQAWVAGACSASCCGGTRSRVRVRACDSPPPSGHGKPCPGSSTETDTQVCNTGQCPLFCRKGDRFFADTCDRCVRRYYRCVGGPTPVEAFCRGSLVWSQRLMACVSSITCNRVEPR